MALLAAGCDRGVEEERRSEPGPGLEEPAPSTDPVPSRSLDGVDPAVRAQLEAEEEALRRRLEAPETGPAERAEAWGRLGTFYHAYDLLEPAERCYRQAAGLAPAQRRWSIYLGAVLERRGHFQEAQELLAAAATLPAASEDVASVRDGVPGGVPDGASDELSGGASGEVPVGVSGEGPGAAAANPAGDANDATVRDGALALRRGRIAQRLGDLEAAQRHFQTALALSPACYAARFGLGEVARDRGELDAAIEHYRAVLAVQPGAAQVHYPLAQALLRAGRESEARPHLDAIAARAVDVGGRPSCPDPLDSLLAERTTGSAAHLRRSQQALLAGNLERELEELTRASELAPRDPAILAAHGNALARARRFAEAAEVYGRAAAIDPEDPELPRGRIEALLRQGEVATALRELEPALLRFPGVPALWSQAAIAHQASGDLPAALAAFERALELDPAATAAGVGRAMILARLGRRAEAAGALESALGQLAPTAYEERLRLATALRALGGGERATAELRRLASDDAAPARIRTAARSALGG